MNFCKYTNKLLKISNIEEGLTKIGFNFYCEYWVIETKPVKSERTKLVADSSYGVRLKLEKSERTRGVYVTKVITRIVFAEI
jgi:hypothetical protein